MVQFIESNEELDSMAGNICLLNPNFQSWAIPEQQALQRKVLDYLMSLQKVAVTFTSNQFRGTPTFVLFNKKEEVLHTWFGHVDRSAIQLAIQHYQEIIRKAQNI
jgi:thioredoxin-related protein